MKTILIVDGDRARFQILSARLGNGRRALHAPDGKTALVILQNHDIHLCLITHPLPNGDCLNLIKKIHEAYAHIPVILLISGPDADPEWIEKAYSFDYFVYYVLKAPFEEDELARCVNECLKHGGIAWAKTILTHYRKKHPGRSPQQEKREKREKRLAEIRNLIEESPHAWTYGKLASRFGLSRRQIQYDLQTLRQRGVAIQSSQNTRGGLVILPDSPPEET
ncbi:MAG: response regulator [Candidatus Omnitrophica bacterium]|nr:response regulator [Candidatus Omnitrophota bacterium]